MKSTELMVCGDCFSAVAGIFADDVVYYDISPEEEKRVLDAVEDSTQKLGIHYPGDGEKDNEFSVDPCKCCNSGLAGIRYHVLALCPDQESVRELSDQPETCPCCGVRSEIVAETATTPVRQNHVCHNRHCKQYRSSWIAEDPTD